MREDIEIKKKFFIKIIVIIVFFIIVGVNFVKNKVEDNSYNNMYEELKIESINENIIEIPKEQNKIKVYVTGAVKTPSVVELEEGARIQDAINLAGGAREDADLEEVNLAYSLEDGEKLYIPNINENVAEYITKESGVNVTEYSKNSETTKVNINTNNVDELKKLPGVGESLAQKIIDYRNENGNFKSIEELKNVNGIGAKKFESMKKYLRVK